MGVVSHVQVDIYSFGMFMYELIALYFPFEKQNLMSSQIEKLVIDGERPPLQNRVSWEREGGEREGERGRRRREREKGGERELYKRED